MGSPKIKSATALRKDLYETLKEVSAGEPQIVTHKQGEPVVLLAKEDYDSILDEREALRKMTIGLSQIESGKGISHSEALRKLKAMKAKWK